MTQNAHEYLLRSMQRRNKRYIDRLMREQLIASIVAAFFTGVFITLAAFRMGWLS